MFAGKHSIVCANQTFKERNMGKRRYQSAAGSLMSIKHAIRFCVGLTSVVIASNVPIATANSEPSIAELAKQISQACPKGWEGVYQEIQYSSSGELWRYNLADKASFVNYFETHAKALNWKYGIENYEHAAGIIYLCADLKYSQLEKLRANALSTITGHQASLETDADADGVSNAFDLCPDTPAQDSVLSNGCSYTPPDTDNDGVVDPDDMCANTPTGLTPGLDGCIVSQRDTDGDGVNDAIDQCAATSATESANDYGCSLSQSDLDNDGVNDMLDRCQRTANNATPDASGCSFKQLDGDGDGVGDAFDQCPNSNGEVVGSNGCAIDESDGDNDGIPDYYDNVNRQCVDLAAYNSSN
ncbi:MAG: hypothetical protein ACI9SP_002886 [Arenicella sp.]